MADNSTSITFSNVNDAVSQIVNCKGVMNDKFNEFGNTIRTLIQNRDFVGSAADAFENKYQELSGTFQGYLDLIQQFADIYTGAARRTEETQNRLEQQAENL